MTCICVCCLAQVNRKQKDGTVTPVNCPVAVAQYTSRMGGVDRFDQRRELYSVSRRSRRWWLRIFYFMLDAALVNAHILYNSVHPGNPMTQHVHLVNFFVHECFEGWLQITAHENAVPASKSIFASPDDTRLARSHEVFRMRSDCSVLGFISRNKLPNSADAAYAVQRHTANVHVFSALCAACLFV